MNRRDFIDELKKRLRKLPYDEIKEAVDYYEGYFDDAGEENEQAVLAELGSPSAVSAQIIAGFAVRSAEDKSVKKNWRSAWLVALALFASPVAIPLALAAGLLALALVIVVSAVIFSFFAASVSMFAGSVICFVSGILVITQSIPTTIYLIGVGLVTLGAGAAIFISTKTLSKKCFGWFSKQVSRFILRGNKI